MSSLKYNDDICSNIIGYLNNASMALEDVASALSTYCSGLPNDTQINKRVDKLSEDIDPITGEKIVDSSKYSYYNGRIAKPLKAAISNMSVLKNATSDYNSEINSIISNLSQISVLIGEFDASNTDVEGVGDDDENVNSGSPSYYEPVYDKFDLIPEKNTEVNIGVNIDTNGDGVPDLNIDNNGDGIADVNIDINSDGKPDLNIDTNKDGVPDLSVDINYDGVPDLNIDTDGDGIADVNIDINHDGKPDLNIDTNKDGVPDLNIDLNHDGKPDLNIDINDDGKSDLNQDNNKDNKPDLNIDTNGDGIPDKNIDSNGDGKIDNPNKPSEKNENVIPNDKNDDVPSKGDEKENGIDNVKDNNEEPKDKSETGDDLVSILGPSQNNNGENGDVPSNNNSNGGSSGIWGSPSENGEGGLFPFVPGNDATSSDGENPDFIFRGLYDQSGAEEGVDVGSINLSGLKGNVEGAVSKGAVAAGAIGLGVAGMDAVATINGNVEKEEDAYLSEKEKEDKKLLKTVISSGILGILSVGYIVATIMSSSSVLAFVLLGVAMIVSSIAAASGLKVGKYISFGVLLATSLLTFILNSVEVVPTIGYIISFVSFVILSIGAYALDLLKGMFEDKVDVLPILIAIIVWMLVTLLKVVELVNWIVYLILVLLVVGGYFLYEKVFKNKISLADGETNQENYVQNVNIPSQQPVVEEKKFDPRDLFKEDNENKPALVDRGINNQNNGNPFMGIDPKNSTFENAFKDDNNNRF